jgi:hypothetical protein
MTHFQLKGRRALAAMALLALASMVAACSGHDDDRDQNQAAPPVTGTTPPPPVASDAFVSYVAQVVATQDETGEPASTEGATLTAPEGAEPLPVPGA